MASLLPLITGGAGALVVLSLWVFAFYSGKLHSDREFTKLEQENGYWRSAYSRLVEAVQTERQAANESAQAGQVTNKLIAALTDVAVARRHSSPVPPGPPVPPPDLTPEDLGL